MTWMLTARGRCVPLDAIGPEHIDLEDIAHHLAHLCRFTGATREFYSVAQHSLLVADLVRDQHPYAPHLALCGLMHDAHEAYLGDISTPVKLALGGALDELDAGIWCAVAARFGLPVMMPAEIKRADRIALAIERRDLLPPHAVAWGVLEGIEPPHDRTVRDYAGTPVGVRGTFTNYFHELQHLIASEAARSHA